LNEKLVRFGTVGVIGFIIDAGILLLAVEIFHLSPLLARIVSFLIAATVTYALNQQFTFQLGDKFSLGRWLSYLATTAIGAFINIGIYRLWVLHMGTTPIELVAGTALGSIAAMFVNFFSSSLLVFRPATPRRSA